MGRAVFPPCCLTWGQTMVEVMRIMATSFKRSHDALLHSVPPALQQATADPCLPRDSWTLTGKSGALSRGVTAPFSWVLMWTRFCLCPPRVSGRGAGWWWACRVGSTERSRTGTGPLEGGHHHLHDLHRCVASGQTTGREHSPAHQQKIGLKIY